LKVGYQVQINPTYQEAAGATGMWELVLTFTILCLMQCLLIVMGFYRAAKTDEEYDTIFGLAMTMGLKPVAFILFAFLFTNIFFLCVTVPHMIALKFIVLK
jgi:hypothetical protein